VTSRTGDVALVATTGSIVDAESDNGVAEVSGNNVTLTAAAGAIGTTAIALEIDSANPAPGVVTATAAGDIVLTEVQGDLSLAQVRSTQADVTLRTLNGAILDGTHTAAANVQAVDITLTAAGGGIGLASDDLRIDSSTPRPGLLRATAAQGVYLTEVSGLLAVRDVEAASGDVRLTVPIRGAAPGQDLTLVDEGQIAAPSGAVLLQIGGDVETALTSLITAGVAVTIAGATGRVDFSGIASTTTSSLLAFRKLKASASNLPASFLSLNNSAHSRNHDEVVREREVSVATVLLSHYDSLTIGT
jgi:hypothetical protein